VAKSAKNTPAADEATGTEPVEFDIPEDLTGLSDAELASLTEQAQAAFDAFAETDDPSDEDLEALSQLGGAVTDLNAEGQRREADAERRKQEFQATIDAVRGGKASDAGDGDEGEGDDGGTEGDAPEAPEDPAEPVEAEQVPVAASARRRGPLRISTPASRAPKLNAGWPALGDIAKNAPDPGIEDVRPELVITAAADVPRLSPGDKIPTLQGLVDATISRAKALGTTNGQPNFVPLASINREFPVTIDETMNPDRIRHEFEQLVEEGQTAKGMEALVAAGGWCAPSEIRYDFFRVSEVSGLLDLPTFGVRRGGLRWPQSLSLADFFALTGAPASGTATAATMPWRWTEADDIATVTGSGAKLCLRPPCPTFDEARLEAFGICVTAGNLTEDAFPELIRHFIAQTVVAHGRAMNRRIIAQVVAASTATNPTGGAVLDGATAHVLGGYELNAVDYREKHGMSDDAVLEGVLPSWLRGLLRSDLAKQNGVGLEKMAVSDEMLRDWFDERGIRMQWVQDWQTRDVASGIAHSGGTIPVTWPTSALGLLYAAGTFGRGNGMTLDLGVVRDSVLNAENDHTAAWSEEATLVARFGHESRVITFDGLIANGATGAQTAPTGP